MKVKFKKRYLLIATALGLMVYIFALPAQLFDEPYSTVLQADNGELLSASIASDGQWRFPQRDSLPDKFTQALIAFEDKRFWDHPGVDLLSLGRAFKQNISAGKVISGGSTVSMQVIRLSRKNKARTIFEKCIELALATRLEFRYSKQEILSLYSAHAPFGGNVVGLEAACWRYFGRSPQLLSWGEAAMLAVLPNAPSLIHPGKNRQLLKRKRDRVLTILKEQGVIDEFTYSLAKEESIPEEPQNLPRLARHLLNRASKEGHLGKRVNSTINYVLQVRAEQIVNDHHQRLKGNQVFNAAVIIVDVTTGNTLAYVGNTTVAEKGFHGDEVDVIMSPRSTGSILKPILHAAMLDDGKIMPKQLLPDVPTLISGFAPQNFSKEYDGAVPADKALIRSLNVPAVNLLLNYRYEKFYNLLQNTGMTTLSNSADHYGLSLILGGAEGTLWDITGIYASMARTLNNYFQHPGKNRYYKKDFHDPHYVTSAGEDEISLDETSWLNAGSIFLTFDALQEVYRPGEETGWRYFSSSKPIAWKTGTSFGLRDGWAIGVTPQYAVGVWVGNASGEGRPNLTGTEAASPIMFDIFAQLPSGPWFQKPYAELQKIVTCKKSGYRLSAHCPEADTLWVTKKSLETSPCPYHQIVHLTVDQKYRLHSECASVSSMKHVSWFVLPPVQEYYYKPKNISYKPLPPYRSDCRPTSSLSGMELIYPKHDAKIFIPRDLDGKPGKAVFELAHRNPSSSVYWHLDGQYIGSTKRSHHFPINPIEGKHKLTLIDDTGESLERHFEVISKR